MCRCGRKVSARIRLAVGRQATGRSINRSGTLRCERPRYACEFLVLWQRPERTADVAPTHAPLYRRNRFSDPWIERPGRRWIGLRRRIPMRRRMEAGNADSKLLRFRLNALMNGTFSCLDFFPFFISKVKNTVDGWKKISKTGGTSAFRFSFTAACRSHKAKRSFHVFGESVILSFHWWKHQRPSIFLALATKILYRNKIVAHFILWMFIDYSVNIWNHEFFFMKLRLLQLNLQAK